MTYPSTPPGHTVARRRTVGPFTTHVAFCDPTGAVTPWSSRAHRKHASRLSRPERPGVWWAPSRASWWIGILFAIGATCFMIGPFPGFTHLVGSAAVGAVFFAGSIFFTTAAALQWLEAINADPGPGMPHPRRRLWAMEPGRIDWWATGVQLVGTLSFNVSTYFAMREGFDAEAYDRLVWTPDAFGSICFLASGYLAYVEACGSPFRPREGRPLEWKIAAVNLLGCVAFGFSAVASLWVPSSGNIIDLAASNGSTALGGLCFLVGAVLLLPEGAADDPGRDLARS